MEELFSNVISIFSTQANAVLFLKQIGMWAIGGVLIFLAIKKQMEPTLLLPMGFGAILMNIPNFSGSAGISEVLGTLYSAGIANELFPLLLFIGIGAMIDFGPILSNPKLMLFGAAAQFGIFMTLTLASIFFILPEAASIAIIGAADGPTSIVVATQLAPRLLGPITVAAYSYMALVPVVQPPIIKLCTTQKERKIKMPYNPQAVSKLTRILFPIIVTVITGLIAPGAAALIGFLMFGNLIRECGVLESLSDTAQKVLANLITLLLGITVAFTMTANEFLSLGTLLILGLGLFAFIFDTMGGVLIAKLFNVFLPEGKKINPMIGAAGISAFPMSARIVHKMGQDEDKQNFLLMHAVGANVSGQIASVIAGGLILNFFAMVV
ncbi:MAG: sodium ion-translocating decarboxylase subunit beta [Clostridiales bacterium]|nr:sodium ion-translocating decarboxylase subunit beta [Clostridiales bacterium]